MTHSNFFQVAENHLVRYPVVNVSNQPEDLHSAVLGIKYLVTRWDIHWPVYPSNQKTCTPLCWASSTLLQGEIYIGHLYTTNQKICTSLCLASSTLFQGELSNGHCILCIKYLATRWDIHWSLYPTNQKTCTKWSDSCWASTTLLQCCRSGMFIPNPGSRIPDPKTAIK
jgi:hypothetical protein